MGKPLSGGGKRNHLEWKPRRQDQSCRPGGANVHKHEMRMVRASSVH